MTDNGLDVREIFDWYGDGECDAFCTRRDTDCASDARTPELANASDVLASRISMADACVRARRASPTGALIRRADSTR